MRVGTEISIPVKIVSTVVVSSLNQIVVVVALSRIDLLPGESQSFAVGVLGDHEDLLLLGVGRGLREVLDRGSLEDLNPLSLRGGGALLLMRLLLLLLLMKVRLVVELLGRVGVDQGLYRGGWGVVEALGGER